MTNKEIRRRIATDVNLRCMNWDGMAMELGISRQRLDRTVIPLRIQSRIKYWFVRKGRTIKTGIYKFISLFKRKKTRWGVFLVEYRTGAWILRGVYPTQQKAAYAANQRMVPPLRGTYKVEEIKWEC